MITHRRTSENLLETHVMLFCDNAKNAHYGSHVWELRSSLPEVPESVAEFAAEFFGCDLEAARTLVNPTSIVETAGAWDNTRFVSEVYHFCGEPIGFRTQDGAVVLDRASVEIVKVA